LGIFLEKWEMQSSKIYKELVNLGENISLVTVKRMLSEMATFPAVARDDNFGVSQRSNFFA